MKPLIAMFAWLLLSSLLVRPSVAVELSAEANKPRVVTQIVNLLESMVKQSKADGDAERILWAKYKCYCDTNKDAKNKEIDQLTEEIAMLEGKIEETQASSGLLTKEAENLDENKAENLESQTDANDLNDKDKTEFEAKEADLKAGIASMKNALEALSDVGADQTVSMSAQHKQYLKGNKKQTAFAQVLRTALLTASAVATRKQKVAMAAFIEGPITGAYSAQSGEIVGILKNMLDTFEADLAESQRKWAEDVKAHAEYISTMQDEHTTMNVSFIDKQGSLAANDASLATLRVQLQDAKKSLGEAQSFLQTLLPKCEAKRKQYEQRVELRVGEDAALAQAISILSSDEAFASLTATSLVEERSVRRHGFAQSKQQVTSPTAFLHQEMGKVGGSVALGKIAALLQAGTPFNTVLAEIKKMLALIVEEGKADTEQKGWCTTERDETGKKITAKQNKISGLNSIKTGLENGIEDPQIGLLVQIKQSEDALAESVNDQKAETTSRTAENLEYQKEVAGLVQAEDLVSKAIRVLKKYYDKLAEEQKAGLVQVARKGGPSTDSAPSTWSDTYAGQSSDNNKAITMLEFLVTNTQKEEKAAHTAELAAQHAFEDEMTRLKNLEASLQDSLTDLRGSLAEKQQELRQKNKDLEATTNEKTAAENYLEDIKPGCDFIMANFVTRDFNRGEETKALNKAITLIKETPAYKNAVLDKHITSLGDCAKKCQGKEETAECKACQADTSVPGYCAGHPTTPGC